MRAFAISGAAAVFLGGLAGWLYPSTPPRLTILSVGQGSCAVLQAGDRTILFDTGPKNRYLDAGTRFVLPKLRTLGVNRVDVVVLSHPDMDHAGGLQAVIGRYPGARILANAGFDEEPKLPAMLKSLGISTDQVGWLPPFARLHIGELAVDLASPLVKSGDDDNNGSVLAKIQGGAYIGGDAPSEVERTYEDWVGPVSVLVADHHGSRSSGDPSFLEEAHPKWIVISVGRNNVYGHPNPEALDRYLTTGAQILRTDRDGDLSFTLRNGRWERLY